MSKPIECCICKRKPEVDLSGVFVTTGYDIVPSQVVVNLTTKRLWIDEIQIIFWRFVFDIRDKFRKII